MSMALRFSTVSLARRQLAGQLLDGVILCSATRNSTAQKHMKQLLRRTRLGIENPQDPRTQYPRPGYREKTLDMMRFEHC
mmetsp:Transcript_2296/g.3218  ORF Transcript_2296/g.3218 Transcript_2296/m.3218 type:complete len:80 (-) Transcript_2296:257-496(-)